MFARYDKMAKAFTRIGKEIAIAVKQSGPDPSGNPRLRAAIQNAKSVNMPKDRVEAAIKRASSKDEKDYEEVIYEGYGPNGVAILVECLTDNRNRAASEVRVAMTRNGGNMADPGSVSYLFNRKGVVIVDGSGTSEDALLDAVLEAGAQEVNDLGGNFEVICEATDLVPVRQAIQAAGIDYESAEATFLPDLYIPLDADGAAKMFKLIEALEDSDEVQNVYANFDVSDEIMAKIDV